MIERANDRARTATVIDSRRRSRDRIPADVQAEKIKRAAEKRARKAAKAPRS